MSDKPVGVLLGLCGPSGNTYTRAPKYTVFCSKLAVPCEKALFYSRDGAASYLDGDRRSAFHAVGDGDGSDAKGAHGHGQRVGPLEQHRPKGVRLAGQKPGRVKDEVCRTLPSALRMDRKGRKMSTANRRARHHERGIAKWFGFVGIKKRGRRRLESPGSRILPLRQHTHREL